MNDRSLLPGEDFRWDAAPKVVAEPLADWIEALEEMDRDRVFSEFEHVQQLQGELGQDHSSAYTEAWE